jgi:hypothetical protein
MSVVPRVALTCAGCVVPDATLTFFQGLCYSPYALRLDCRALGNMTGEHVPA